MSLFEEVFRIEDLQAVRCVDGTVTDRESVKMELLAKIFREAEALRRSGCKSFSESSNSDTLMRMLSSLDSILLEGNGLSLSVRILRKMKRVGVVRHHS